MPRIDRLLGAIKQPGDALRLAAGKPAQLERGAALHPLTADPLTEAQVNGLLQEIIPAELAQQLAGTARLQFAYQSPTGPIEVTVAAEAGVVSAVLRMAPGAVPQAKAAAEPDAPDLSAARAEMDRLLRRLVELGGSDLHLRSGAPPLVRKDGELVRLEEPPIGPEALETLLRSIMPPRGFAGYRGENDHDWAYEIAGLARYRCNAGRDRTGPTGVFRQIPAGIRSADELGLSREVQQLCSLTKGLVLVTGPTGSGKSTTLAAMTDLVNSSRADHIITIEDPIEFVHQSKRCLITQREVGTHTRSFKAALRAALREDPDVVLVGEMRDLETVSIAIETAETGHLVFGTLHTTTAASTLDRIIDQFPTDRQSQIRVMLSESLRGVVAQVLCRKIGGGRVAAREVLLSIPAVANLIREGKTFQIPSIMQTNRKVGMVTLNDALMDLVQAGSIEPREAYIKSADKAGLLGSLKAKGVNTAFLGDA
ncbi:MAG TPA: type IV pilus twitching motility protein PilT [Gemmatimonadales bacterium]|nr:type IV pilus twitching motility protein PilT [Gemmatimonadales bacterium]